MRKILESCPTCEGDLIATELSCTRCDTQVTGRFRPSVFDRLSEDDLRFIEIFVKNKGNVKDMERELDVSYWSIRSRLNDVIERLGFDTEPDPAAGQQAARQDILDRLEAGDISVQEAAAHLAQLRHAH